MAQVNLSSRAGASYIGIESTYGTTPSMTRIFPNSIELKLKQEQVKVEEERARGRAHVKPSRGLKSSECKLAWNLKPPATRLVASATPAAPWCGLPLHGLWGGYTADEGDTVQASSTTSLVKVASGANFYVGSWILVEVAGALEPCKILSKSSNDLSVWPNLSATPTTSGLVVNGYHYYPVEPTNTSVPSLTLQHAKSNDSSYQLTANGLTGEVDITLERGKHLAASAELMGAGWTGPSSQSLTATAAADPLGAPVVLRSNTLLVQPVATTTRTHYKAHSVAAKLKMGNLLVPELGGSTEGVTAAFAAPERPAGTVTIRQRADTSTVIGWYDNETELSVVCWQMVGSGTTAKFVLVEFRGTIAERPDLLDDGGRQVHEYTLELLEDSTTTASGTVDDLAYACARVAVF